MEAARECCLINDHGLAENEVVGCLGLNHPSTGRTRQRSDFPVGIARREKGRKKRNPPRLAAPAGNKAIKVKPKASLAAVVQSS